MTPRCALAEAIGFCRPLPVEQMELLCDGGLAMPDEFEAVEDDEPGFPVVTGYRYVGDAWEVEFRHGRPVLVERGTATTGYVAEVERRFAWVLRLVRGPDRGPRTDEEIAALRSSTEWAGAFARAADADRRMSELRRRGGPELELAAERLARARAVLARLGVELSGMWTDPLRIGDESAMARYALVTGTDDHSGEPHHAIEFHGDPTAAVEGVLCTMILDRWVQGLFDLDRAHYVEPLILHALVTIEGDSRFGIRRVVPFAAAEGRPT